MKIQMIKKLGIVSCLAVACAVVSPSVVRAQSNAGFILFGGIKDSALDYCLDNGSSGRSDRYYLEVKPQKWRRRKHIHYNFRVQVNVYVHTQVA